LNNVINAIFCNINYATDPVNDARSRELIMFHQSELILVCKPSII